MPWYDQGGRFSGLKLATLLCLLAPAVWVLLQIPLELLEPRPVTLAIHATGLWAIRFLLLTLFVTPCRRIFLWPRVFILRRMLGLSVLAYALGHFCLFIVDKAFDLGVVANELVLRYYLTIGLLALFFLIALGVTSTDLALRRMGIRRWRRLHGLVYPALFLALVHFFMQSKLDVTQPTLLTGLALWLMLYRLVDRRFGRQRALGPVWLLSLTVATTALTALGEALYYHLAIGAPAILVLRANLSLGPAGWRPALIVTLSGLAVVIVATLRRLARHAARPMDGGLPQ
ncbi:protein-methionine-sulfoxide reductase heme-binding subunit MsrQ [Arboricoccus pini]|nr:ferric reductase-like transmembrane domain-containing protein [Arboricoccus pini]